MNGASLDISIPTTYNDRGKHFEGYRKDLNEQFKRRRSSNSLRAKWSTFQHDAYVWITSSRRIEREQPTGNSSAAKRFAMIQVLHSVPSGTIIDDKKGRRRFKYVNAAEYVSRYPIFMDLSNVTSTKVSDRGPRAIFCLICKCP